MIKQSKLLITLLVICSTLFVNCSKDDDDDFLGNWVQETVFYSTARTEAVCFTINNYAYVGTGYNIDEKERFQDFFRFDGEAWTQIAPFPGVARNGAIAFSSSTKGYCGTGYDGDNKLKDFYEYDPNENSWTKKSDFGGTARYGAVAFYVDGKGYIGTGYDENNTTRNDFWEYDIDLDQWTEKASFGRTKRRNAMSFVLNGEAYVLSGLDNGDYLDDMYKYDTENNTWIELGRLSDYEDASYDDDYSIPRYKGCTFVMDGKAYVTTGVTGSNSQETWEYKASTDRWTQKTDFEGSARYGAVGFTINNQGFVATGGNGSYSFADTWSLYPNDEYEKKD